MKTARSVDGGKSRDAPESERLTGTHQTRQTSAAARLHRLVLSTTVFLLFAAAGHYLSFSEPLLMATARLRKAFRYPDDSEGEEPGREDLDEEGGSSPRFW